MSWMLAEIGARGGAVPFRDFMELALYHPRFGYYSHDAPRYGRHGDYLTAPTASSWYAAVLARVLREVAARVGPLVFVDLASGDGCLLGHLFDVLDEDASSVLDAVVSVERSAAMRQLQQERLALRVGGGGVMIAGKLGEVERPAGAVLLHASELYDALAVHRVVAGADGLLEQWVVASGDRLKLEERPACPEVAGYFLSHGVELVQGQVAEANLAAAEVHAAVLDWAEQPAAAMVLDYGYEARRLYDPRGRSRGSLACYRRHRLQRDPLADPGEQDLTAHVNWDDLRRPATQRGWCEVGLWPLAEMLVRGGLAAVMEAAGQGIEAELDAATVADRQEIKRLLDPEGMGSDLRVLVQADPEMVEAMAQAFLGGVP